MVKSKLDDSIVYTENKKLDVDDINYDATLYEIGLMGHKVLIALGKPKYTYIDKKYRIHFLENLDRNIYQVCPEVILICDFCKIFESDEDKQYLIIHLNRFAKNYLPRQVYGNQLKFFKDIIELLHIEQSKNSFKKVLADII